LEKEGATIARTYQFKDFPAAIQFVNAVAALAEQAWHHPDIDIRWNRVTLALTTHDAGGLTEKDLIWRENSTRCHFAEFNELVEVSRGAVAGMVAAASRFAGCAGGVQSRCR